MSGDRARSIHDASDDLRSLSTLSERTDNKQRNPVPQVEAPLCPPTSSFVLFQVVCAA